MRHRENEDQKDIWRQKKYDIAHVNDKLMINLRDLAHMMRFFHEEKGSQMRILVILNEIGCSITQRDLTEKLGIQPGSASEVIAKLESSGYIKRTPSQEDRRTVDIELTEMGKLLAEEAMERRSLRYEELFSCLTSEEKEQLLLLLEKINSDWKCRYHDIKKKGKGCHKGDKHHRSAHHLNIE